MPSTPSSSSRIRPRARRSPWPVCREARPSRSKRLPYAEPAPMTAELILIVDDEPSILELARLYLERDGFQVAAVADGEAALAAAADRAPALIVLDVMLPKLDGFEVCRRLRGRGDGVPIVMLTARDEDIDKILGL